MTERGMPAAYDLGAEVGDGRVAHEQIRLAT